MAKNPVGLKLFNTLNTLKDDQKLEIQIIMKNSPPFAGVVIEHDANTFTLRMPLKVEGNRGPKFADFVLSYEDVFTYATPVEESSILRPDLKSTLDLSGIASRR